MIESATGFRLSRHGRQQSPQRRRWVAEKQGILEFCRQNYREVTVKYYFMDTYLIRPPP